MQDPQDGDHLPFDAIHHHVVGMDHGLTGTRDATRSVQGRIRLDTQGVIIEALVLGDGRQGLVAGDEVHDAFTIRHGQRMPEERHPLPRVR